MNKELIKTYKAEFDHWLSGGNVQVYYKKDDEPKWLTDEECIEYEGHDNFSHIMQNSLEPEDVLIIIDDEYIHLRSALAEGKTIQLDEAAKFSDPNRRWVDLSCKSFGSSTHLFPVNYYRIKPEEPKFPCFYREKCSGIVVKFPKQSNRFVYSLSQELGVVVESNLTKAQKYLGFEWRCWDTFINPDRWEHLSNYVEKPKFKVGDWVVHNGVIKQVTKAVDGLIDSLDNQVAVIMKEESLELWEPRREEYFWYKNDLVKFHETQANLGLLLESARGCSYYPAEKNFEDFCEPFVGKLPSNLKQDSENISVE